MILERDDGGGAPETLRFARSCSSALSPALKQRLEEALGVPVVEAYGMTEASHQMASNPLPPRPASPARSACRAAWRSGSRTARAGLVPPGRQARS